MEEVVLSWGLADRSKVGAGLAAEEGAAGAVADGRGLVHRSYEGGGAEAGGAEGDEDGTEGSS